MSKQKTPNYSQETINSFLKYKKTRREYRKSLNAFVSWLIVGVLLVGLVTPMVVDAAITESQVFSGPIHQSYGIGMIQIDSYGVDINALGATSKTDPVSRQRANIAERISAGVAKQLQAVLPNNEPNKPTAVIARDSVDARVWETKPSGRKISMSAYILPSFIIIGTDGKIFTGEGGQAPQYLPISALPRGSNEPLSEVRSVPRQAPNLLTKTGASPHTTKPFEVVFTKNAQQAQLSRAVATNTERTPDAVLDLGGSEFISPIYSSSEAYVYFSPKSAMTQYSALKTEYAQISDELIDRAQNSTGQDQAQAIIQSGLYLASMMILEGYLNETLAQDGSRGWANFNYQAWGIDGTTSRQQEVANRIGSGEIQSYAKVNNKLSAVNQDGSFATFEDLKNRDSYFRHANGGSYGGIFIAPYHPIQFHLMPESEDIYRFQVLNTIDIETLGNPLPQDSTSVLSAARALFRDAGMGREPEETRAALLNGAATRADVVGLGPMIRAAQDYVDSKNRFYSPIKPTTGQGQIAIARVSVARTPVLPGLVFMGYQPVTKVDGSWTEENTPGMSPRHAVSSMYFAPPSTAPSISVLMSEDQYYNTLNAELWGLFSDEFYSSLLGIPPPDYGAIALGTVATILDTGADRVATVVGGVSSILGWRPGVDFAKAETGDQLSTTSLAETIGEISDATHGATIIADFVDMGGKNTINKVGVAWSSAASASDQTISQNEETDDASVGSPGATEEVEDTPGIIGNSTQTGRRAIYTGQLTAQRVTETSELNPPLSAVLDTLDDAYAAQMLQQGFRVDISLASIGGWLQNNLNPFAHIARMLAGASHWLLTAGVSLFEFAFGASMSMSGTGTSQSSIFGNWKNPFELLIQTPGLGGVYSILQNLALLFIALFALYLGFATILSAGSSSGAGGDPWPIQFSGPQVQLKHAIPRIVVAMLFVGLPTTPGSPVVPGLSYWLGSFILMINDTLCNILAISASTSFIAGLADVSAMAGESVISALVYALIAFVMFWAFVAGAIMLIFRTFFLYLFILVGPIVWAFWVLEPTSSGGGDKFKFSVSGDMPKLWLKAFTQTVFIQLFWVFAFFILSSLFTSPELTAGIFGTRQVGAVGAVAAYGSTIPIVTGLANSVDLIIRAIIVVLAFWFMVHVGMMAFKSAAVSGLAAANSAVGNLKKMTIDKATDKYKAGAKRMNDIAASGMSGDFKTAKEELRAAGKSVRDSAVKGTNKAVNAARKARGATKSTAQLAKDLKNKETRDKRMALERKKLAARTTGAISGAIKNFKKDALAKPKGTPLTDDELTAKAKAKAGDKWDTMTDAEKDLMKKDIQAEHMTKEEIKPMTEEEMKEAGIIIHEDGSVTGGTAEQRKRARETARLNKLNPFDPSGLSEAEMMHRAKVSYGVKWDLLSEEEKQAKALEEFDKAYKKDNYVSEAAAAKMEIVMGSDGKAIGGTAEQRQAVEASRIRDRIQEKSFIPIRTDEQLTKMAEEKFTPEKWAKMTETDKKIQLMEMQEKHMQDQGVQKISQKEIEKNEIVINEDGSVSGGTPELRRRVIETRRLEELNAFPDGDASKESVEYYTSKEQGDNWKRLTEKERNIKMREFIQRKMNEEEVEYITVEEMKKKEIVIENGRAVGGDLEDRRAVEFSRMMDKVATVGGIAGQPIGDLKQSLEDIITAKGISLEELSAFARAQVLVEQAATLAAGSGARILTPDEIATSGVVLSPDGTPISGSANAIHDVLTTIAYQKIKESFDVDKIAETVANMGTSVGYLDGYLQQQQEIKANLLDSSISGSTRETLQKNQEKLNEAYNKVMTDIVSSLNQSLSLVWDASLARSLGETLTASQTNEYLQKRATELKTSLAGGLAASKIEEEVISGIFKTLTTSALKGNIEEFNKVAGAIVNNPEYVSIRAELEGVAKDLFIQGTNAKTASANINLERFRTAEDLLGVLPLLSPEHQAELLKTISNKTAPTNKKNHEVAAPVENIPIDE